MKHTCTVRVQDFAYKRGDTYYSGKSLRVLKSQSTMDFITEEVDAVGLDDALGNIINLTSVPSGIYSLVYNVNGYDIESGYPDDWTLELHAIEDKE